MLSKITEFWLKAHASNLGQDAVIEIMIALLGVMVMVLTLVAGLLSVFVAIVGIFGFGTIREEARKAAENIAGSTATKVAQDRATKMMIEISERAQASGLSESQAEEAAPSAPKKKTGRKKATSDKGLDKG